MKIKNIILSICFSVALLSGCGSLDYNEITVNDEDWVFENISQIDRLLVEAYACIIHDLSNDYSGAMLSSATDESDHPNSLSAIHRYYNGFWSSENPFPTIWTNSYQAIYTTNDFLEKMDKVNEALERYKYNQTGGLSYNVLKAKIELYPFQARFLRAYFHFELAKAYGNVPLVTKTLTIAEANAMKRTPVQEIFQFIVDECDAIVELLPISYVTELDQQIGRINRPSVLALKARALLYAASPLHNPANPKEAWKKAALANLQLIEQCAKWGIVLSPYNSLWGANSYLSSEIFFIRRWGNNRTLEVNNYPIGYENAGGGNCPTQNLVDSYEYSKAAPANLRGKTWPQAEKDGILPANPYQNLDPRFGLTVAYNGNVWPTVSPYSTTPLQTFYGGRNGLPLLNATKTGYYLKKYLDGTRNITTASPNTSNHSWIIYRLGEFYLNYAEAMFNYMGRSSTTVDNAAGLYMSANDAINVLRNRTDINMPEFGSETNGDVWEERYIRERMIELAFEGHRFWDVRRWKKGEQFFKEIKTIAVAIDGTATRGVPISRLWNERNNLYPIPFGELIKAPNLDQNPGW